jgi:hypothetical protein
MMPSSFAGSVSRRAHGFFSAPSWRRRAAASRSSLLSRRYSSGRHLVMRVSSVLLVCALSLVGCGVSSHDLEAEGDASLDGTLDGKVRDGSHGSDDGRESSSDGSRSKETGASDAGTSSDGSRSKETGASDSGASDAGTSSDGSLSKETGASDAGASDAAASSDSSLSESGCPPCVLGTAMVGACCVQ